MNEFNNLISYNFSQASKQYLKNAKIQKISALQIIENLPKHYKSGLILDLGSGPGTLEHTQTNCLNNVISFDLSLSMLKQNQNNLKVCADAQNIPFKNDSFENIISNLMLQWPENKQQTIAEINRILKPSGIIICVTLIKNSLYELQQAWKSIDDQAHTLNFLTSQNYLELFKHSNFEILEHYNFKNTYYFNNLYELLHHFKKTGTNLAKSNSNTGLGGKVKLKKLAKSYEKYRTNDGLPISYIYCLIIAQKKGV